MVPLNAHGSASLCKRLHKLTSGYRLGRGNLVKQAKITLERAGVFALRDRRVKKRSFRRLWIARLNAACRARGLRYGELISGLQRAMVALDRKALSEIAIHDPDAFTKIVELARANLPKPAKV